MGELSDLPNIGPVLEAQLNEAGIFTAAELRTAGSRDAWARILENDSSACMNRLLSLEGAVRGVSKKLLDEETRALLKEFYSVNKPAGMRRT